MLSAITSGRSHPAATPERLREAEDLVERALAALGGMTRFVPRDSTVLIKPNICVAYHTYEYAATTNPWVVGALVRLAMAQPAVRFIAVSDLVEANAQKLAKTVGASVASTDNRAIIAHPDVNAVIVSTSEGEHLDAVLAAIELGKPVLVEKPIALSLGDAGLVLR